MESTTIADSTRKSPRAKFRVVTALSLLFAVCAFMASASQNAFALSQNEIVAPQVDAIEQDQLYVEDYLDNAESDENILPSEIPVNWLPDLRVMTGSPDSIVDVGALARKMCAMNCFGNDVKPDELEWEVVQNTKPKVAEVKIFGSYIRVRWNDEENGKTKLVLKAKAKGADEHKAYVAFNAESWKPDYMRILAVVIGGLGLFLLGMKYLTAGLTAIAGANLRKIISCFTDNRFLAVGVGVLTTSIVQSSSATSVMALGFVDSGLMTLTQAINVIIGTNIGTTTTGWLLTVKIGAAGLPMLGVAALAIIFTKNEKFKHYATLVLGLGMIFFGLETLKGGMAPLSDLPSFAAMIQKIQATSLADVGMGILVGAVITAIVQSSSASVAIVITLAMLDTINLPTAVAIVLGCNIGTTITACMASIGSGANARRAACFHVIFNVCGVLWVWALFFVLFVPMIDYVGAACGLESTVSKIALTHTIFNVVNMIVFLPLSDPIAKMLSKLFKDGDVKPTNAATDLAKWVNLNATLGLARSRLVVQDMFRQCQELVGIIKQLHNSQYANEAQINDAFAIEDKLDHIQDETIEFITRMTRKANSSDLTSSAQEQIRLAQELETISDYLTGALKSNLKLKNNGKSVPKSVADDSLKLLEVISQELANLKAQFEKHEHKHLAEPMKTQRDQCVAEVKARRDAFQQEMFEQKYEPEVITAVDYQLNAWRRMFEHLLNISEAMEAPAKSDGMLSRV